MTDSIRRALRTAVTIAGLAALGGGLTIGTAAAEQAHPTTSSLGAGDDYRGPSDDGFDDDATRKDYRNHHGPSHRRGCADSDDPQNYNDCSIGDFKAGGPRDGDGYDNSNRRRQDDNVPAGQPPRSLFTNKDRDRERRLSPPASFFN